jgi:hypothetical protein
VEQDTFKMPAQYTDASPWYNTTISNNSLGILNIRSVSAESDDFLYTIQPQYNLRPDLLAYDLYGNAALWWVFIQRNLDVLQDPIFDFTAGTQIYIPKNSSLTEILGI